MIKYIYGRVGYYIDMLKNLYSEDQGFPTGPGPIPSNNSMEFEDFGNMLYEDNVEMIYEG